MKFTGSISAGRGRVILVLLCLPVLLNQGSILLCSAFTTTKTKAIWSNNKIRFSTGRPTKVPMLITKRKTAATTTTTALQTASNNAGGGIWASQGQEQQQHSSDDDDSSSDNQQISTILSDDSVDLDAIDAKLASKPFRPGPEVQIGPLKLNWFGAIWGVIGVSLGFFWWTGLVVCQVFQFLTRKKLDPQWRLPVEVSHLWGTTVLRLTGCYPIIYGKDNLKSIYKTNQETGKRTPVMFVANHSSWMDIYFVAVSIGWKNYKMIAKKELLKVPFLSKSLKVAKHILLDRTDRKSQFQTYKKGVQYLKDGVNLVTFAEGTRSDNGRLGPFKKGAFRMATAQGASIVPVSIRYAHKVHPKEYALPVRMGRRIPASLFIGEPVTPKDFDGTEDELMEYVWDQIATKLPESQKPLVGTPKTVN